MVNGPLPTTSSLLLLHSPLVGPSTWTPTADRLRGTGRAVAVPDLTQVTAAPPPWWAVVVDAAVAAADGLGETVAVLAHSGAGAYVPAVADRLGDRVSAMVFVDAVVPPESGTHVTSPDVRDLLDAQTQPDGRLRRWLEWWPDDVVRRLLPDETTRTRLLDEMPRLPRSLHDEAVPVPSGWSADRCAYLRLSHAYDDEWAEAGARGWTRLHLDADHLAVCTDPARVARAILDLLDRVGA